MSGKEEKTEIKRARLPGEGELIAKVLDIVGDDRVRAICSDGKIRICRIPGRFRKRMWIRVGDYILVVPWEFQKDKADVVYRYEKSEVEELRKAGLLKTIEEMSF